MMARAVRRAAVALVLALPAASQGPAPAQTAAAILASHPPTLVARLMREKVVIVGNGETKGGAPGAMLTALVIFEQPRDRALRLLAQTARQSEYRPELKRVETVERDENTTVDEHRMRIMLMQIDYRVRTRYDLEHGRISWKIDPDFENDLEDLEGSWELYALAEKRTLGRFGTRVSIGPALPIWVQEYATRQNLPQTMERMRRWVDSNGTYRP
jgi:hypothetical protein